MESEHKLWAIMWVALAAMMIALVVCTTYYRTHIQIDTTRSESYTPR
jgi:hypothetical protein